MPVVGMICSGPKPPTTPRPLTEAPVVTILPSETYVSQTLPSFPPRPSPVANLALGNVGVDAKKLVSVRKSAPPLVLNPTENFRAPGAVEPSTAKRLP